VIGRVRNKILTCHCSFYSFCKVGNGYSDAELSVLQQLLEKHWHPYNTTSAPSWLKLAEPFKEKPDVWIHPKNSRILQVKGAQIFPSDKFKVGWCLRFPRVVKIRLDKSWDQSQTVEQIQQLAVQFGGRYARRKYGELQEHLLKESQKRKKWTSTGSGTKRTRTVLPQFKAADISLVEVESDIFAEKEFSVINGDELHCKSDLEVLIYKHGGSYVQYPGDTTNYVIASRKVLRVQNLIASERFDILHSRWLIECAQERKWIPLEPKYLLYSKPETKELFLMEIDKYGDKFSVDCNVQTLQEIFQEMNNSQDKENTLQAMEIDQSFLLEVEQKYFVQQCCWWSLFRRYRIYLDKYLVVSDPMSIIRNSSLDYIALLLLFYGATLTETIDQWTTHIVMDRRDLSRYREIRKQMRLYMIA